MERSSPILSPPLEGTETRPLRIMLVTDTWAPDISGVVRTYMTTTGHLRRLGHHVDVITPEQFFTIPIPGDTQLRLAVGPGRKVARMIAAAKPDAVHVATEGTLGHAARKWCLKHLVPFTTSYTTKFPEHLHARFWVPESWVWPLVRRFHRPAAGVMVATDTLACELARHGITNTVRWSRGVDTDLFRPRPKEFLDAPRPIFLYVGRVAVEKNIEAFLNLDLDGTKYVVGDGPLLARLKRKYPQARFPGAVHGEELARYYAAADVMVFPSRTDTFGLVLLESLACGVPVAAYPVAGPLDVIGDSGTGALDDDLGRAVRQALTISPEKCRSYAQQFSWSAVAEQFVENLHRIDWSLAAI